MTYVPPQSYISNFDSASGFLRAIARFLQGKCFPGWGLGTPVKRVVSMGVYLSRHTREIVSAGGGIGEGISPPNTREVSSERIASWVTGVYPERPWPGIMICSSSGALVHLAAALGMFCLPQTAFVPVRQTAVHPDDAKAGFEAGLEPGQRLLETNPDLQLHHTHDPNQDRLMLHMMTHFRVKLLKLPGSLQALHPPDPSPPPGVRPFRLNLLRGRTRSLTGNRIRPLLRHFTIAASLISSWNLNPVSIVALAAALLVYQVGATKPEMGRGQRYAFLGRCFLVALVVVSPLSLRSRCSRRG